MFNVASGIAPPGSPGCESRGALAGRRWGQNTLNGDHVLTSAICWKLSIIALGSFKFRVNRAIFTNCIGTDDVEAMRSIFHPGILETPYHSVNTDVNKRIRYLD